MNDPDDIFQFRISTSMKFYKKISASIALIFLFTPSVSFADDTITGQYCYTYGDKESLAEAKEIARTLAIRNGLESYRVFVELTTKVTNFTLTNDLVQILSAGYLKNVSVVKHKEEGRTICDTITAMVNPAEIETVIRRETVQRVQKFEEAAIDINKCLKIVSAKETICGDTNAHNRCIRVVVKGIQQPAFCDHRLRRVFIDYFDKDGEPLDGASKEVLYTESGEVRAVEFSGDSLPHDEKSFRVWLKHFILLEE